MVQGPSIPAIQVLRDAASSPSSRLSALKQIKTDIIGHYQRKEANVKHGLVEPLVAILAAASQTHPGSTPAQHDSTECLVEEEVILQTVLVLGTLANGGPAFVQPLMAANSIQVLLGLLSPDAAPQLLTSVLHTVHRLATSYAELSDAVDATHPPPPVIFTHATIDAFLAILNNPSTAGQRLRLVADIITIAVRDENTKNLLNRTRVLDALAGLAIWHSIANRYVELRGHLTPLLRPPPTNAVPSILAAIATIISGSTYRAHSFFLAAPVRDMFRASWHAKSDQRHLFGPRYGFQSYGGPLLPPLHIPTYATMSYTNASRAFPAVAAMQTNDRRAASMAEVMQQGGDPDHASAVIGWLLVFARTLHGRDRLAALRLLALVNSAMDSSLIGSAMHVEMLREGKERERQLALIAVPMTVSIIQAASEMKRSFFNVSEQQENQDIKEQACDVLALLIAGKKELQTAAADADAIKHVCSILKKSFDTVPLTKPMWNARSPVPEPIQPSEACKMGPRGMPVEIMHAMRCRRSALEAIAALAKQEDVHRKAVVEAGVVQCIVDSLKPFPTEMHTIPTSDTRQLTSKDGNTKAVVIAACHAAQSMARSVSLLRTSLLDGGLAKPIFDLLSSADVDVQTAAIDVAINLLLDFSPLRDEFLSAGVVTILAGLARTSNLTLKALSLHALKHVVQGAPKEVRINVLEELGVDWLVSAIKGDTRETTTLPNGGGVSIGLCAPNAAGEQVDLLNPSLMDVDEPGEDEDAFDEDEDEDGEMMYDESSSTHYQASQLRSTLNPPARSFNSKKFLSAVKEIEFNAALKASQDDVALQEQALDFVRNILNGEVCEPMLQHLFAQIGTAKFFELLTSKFSPLQIQRVAGRPVPVHHPTELILAVVHVIVHVANASPKHRQLLIAQKPLLQAWVPHFSHADRQVRVFSVWAVNALTHTADGADKEDARQRVRELRAVGIDAAVRNLTNDPDLDIRERVKTAVRQLDGL